MRVEGCVNKFMKTPTDQHVLPAVMLPSAKPKLCVTSHVLRIEKESDTLIIMKLSCQLSHQRCIFLKLSLRKCLLIKVSTWLAAWSGTQSVGRVSPSSTASQLTWCIQYFQSHPTHIAIYLPFTISLLLVHPLFSSLFPSLFFSLFFLSSLLLGYFQPIDFFWLGSWLPKYTDFAG